PVGPGWANPETGTFDDPRLRGRDGKPYGPLPRAWARYRGLYHHGSQIILSYMVGQAAVLETPAYELLPAKDSAEENVAFTRTLNVGKSPHDLLLRVAPVGVAVAVVSAAKLNLTDKDGFTLLHIPAAATPVNLKLLISSGDNATLQSQAKTSAP